MPSRANAVCISATRRPISCADWMYEPTSSSISAGTGRRGALEQRRRRCPGGRRRPARCARSPSARRSGRARPACTATSRPRSARTRGRSPSVAGSRAVRLVVDRRPRHAGVLSKRGPLAEVAPELEVGVDARLDAAEQLQDQALAEDHRRVALLGAERRRLGRLVALQRGAQRRRRADPSAARRRCPSASGGRGRRRAARGTTSGSPRASAEHGHVAAAAPDARHDAARAVGQQVLGALTLHQRPAAPGTSRPRPR